MTDNEIKKALECCKMPVGSGACNSCSLKTVRDSLRKEDTKSCTAIMMENALDLINRQQVEIEKLNVELVGMRGACESYKMHYDKAQTEIERLTVNKNACALGMKRLAEQLEQAKSEAIKEFARRARGMVMIRGRQKDYFDDLVKEMTESPTKIEHSSLCETESFKFAIDEDGILTIVGGPKKLTRKEYRELQYKKAQKYR